MVRRRPQAWRSVLVLAASAMLVSSCIPVPLGSRSPDIQQSRFVMGEGDAARIHVSPEYRQDYVQEFEAALTEGDDPVELTPAVDIWPTLFPAADGRVQLSEVYDPEVIARIHEAGLTGLVVLLPRERPESETVAEGPFLSKEEYIHSAAAAVITFGGSVDATTHTLTASGGDSLFWPGFYFFVFITTTDMQDSGQQSLVGIVRSDIIAGAGDRQPHVVIVASGL